MTTHDQLAVEADKKQGWFRDELAKLLNQHGWDEVTQTPDFILADMLVGHLEAYNHATARRVAWFFSDQVVKL